ncbi:UvrD-helicase domain-containing protein [Anditalea andensis]|uniref:DNA 3'-5' helicase n=1 Tax=Anditalea andensis TaxID=1048983 RepID=A0A074KR20_9BACT|nr:UvrD-helicase domain-containing protein [Anditalea andensis]KEO72401.1 DNA helicase UvrD [Anditalea andensis]
MEKPFIIYKSAAGSGKTYTLTLEYLKLALAHPHAYKSILAVTFTNKATKEMKERILHELSRLKRQVIVGDFMDDELLKHFSISPEQLKFKASTVLSAILHDYSSFSISTIDSFFQKVVRAFAREMDLPAKFDVELDQDGVLDRVVDRIIMKTMDDPYLHKWLVDYAQEKIQEGKSWDIRSSIKSLGKQIFQEDFKKYQKEIKIFLKDRENVAELRKFIEANRKLIILKAEKLKIWANEIRVKHGLEWTDFSGSSNTFAKKFDKLGDPVYPIPDLTEKQQLLCLDINGWYSKSCKKIDKITAAYHEGLREILGNFQLLRTDWNSIDAIRKNFYVYGIFRNLLDELSELKDEENILMISDANDFLKEITQENDAPFVYEKVGNKYQNFLIDEFQDTSGFQWASFKPLLENSLGYGHTNLLVGDVKQSIYRWRGGEMNLLLEEVENQIGTERIDVRNLDTNFRSLPNVVDFNNAVFSALPSQLQQVVETTYKATGTDVLSRAYLDVHQKIAPKKAESVFKGKVRIEFLEEDKDEEEGKYKEQVPLKLPAMVMDLQDKGYALKDIAFLVRNKKEGQLIADIMMATVGLYPGYRFDVLSDEAMLLEVAPSVKALVAAFKYLLDQEDKVQYKAMWYYRAVIFDEEISHELFEINSLPVHLQEKALQMETQIGTLLQMPLMEMLEEMLDLLDIAKTGQELAYVSGFKEAVYEFISKNRADLAGFLNWWEEHKTKRTVKIPEGHDAMRILTIHKSKGLQFKVVLMPFLEWTIFDTGKDNVIWSPYSAQGLPPAVVPLSLKKELADSVFKETFGNEVVMAYLDALNMLYVALTRAEEVFWGLCPYKPFKKDQSYNYLAINLQRLFESGDFAADQLNLNKFFDPGTRTLDLGEWPESKLSSKQDSSPKSLRWEYKNWKELLQVRKYAGDFSEGAVISKRAFGLLIHEVLEHSKSLEDALLNIEAFYFEGRINETEQQEVVLQLKKLFEQELFKSWFEGEGILLSEQGILLPGGKHKRPDRVVLDDHKATVVDFKTGEERSHYASQVKEYMYLVEGLTQKPVKGYLCYLESGNIVEV